MLGYAEKLIRGWFGAADAELIIKNFALYYGGGFNHLTDAQLKWEAMKVLKLSKAMKVLKLVKGVK